MKKQIPFLLYPLLLAPFKEQNLPLLKKATIKATLNFRAEQCFRQERIHRSYKPR